MPDIKNQLRRYILDNFVMGWESSQLADSDSFMERHVLDSTGFLELVAFLEETYGIKVLDEEMIPENLDSLDGLERYMRAKMAVRNRVVS